MRNLPCITSVDDGVEKFLQCGDGLLIDVRNEDEYAAGHIPGSINIPLSAVPSSRPDKTKLLFVYCKSGKRSGRAVDFWTSRGYDAVNIGGIDSYTGKTEK